MGRRGGGGGSWRAARFPLETQSFCFGRRRRHGELAAWGSRSGWEAWGGLGARPSRGPQMGVELGGSPWPGKGGTPTPALGRLSSQDPAYTQGTHPRPTPRPAFSPPHATSQGDALHVSAFSAASGLPDAPVHLWVCVPQPPSSRGWLTSPTAFSGLVWWEGGSRQVQSTFDPKASATGGDDGGISF